MRCKFCYLLVLVLLFMTLVPSATAEDTISDETVQKGIAAVEPVLSPFDYKGVKIDGGHMKEIYDEVGSSYLRLSVVDNMLKGFRERAGLPAPGEELGSWYDDGLYNMFGQVISGLARFYAGTGDIAYKQKVDELVHEWGLTIEEDGFFFNTESANSSSYVYDKIACGLIDAYLYSGNEEALLHLSHITDWAEKKLPRNRHPLNYTIEWYTLSENLYRAYLITGDERYHDFAKVWHYPEYWDLYANKEDIFTAEPWEGRPDHYHAYSNVNTLNGAAMAYRITGEEKYLKTIKNAYDFMMDSQIFATGGYGPNERLMPKEDLIQSLYSNTHKNFETQCGSWAAFKLTKHLMTITGDARYGKWVELLVYNGIGASLPTAKEGNVMYSSAYQVRGSRKQYAADPWTCCSGTRPQTIADFADQIYMHDDNSIYVNLYNSSSVEWNHNGVDVKLIQTTDFPQSEIVEFTIEASDEAEFGLRFRNPDWLAKNATAKVNGEKVELSLLDTGWLGIDRKWKNGDKVTLTLPMNLHISRMDPDKEYPAAIMYGPVVLAIKSTLVNNNPANYIDLDNLEEALRPIEGKPLHFDVVSTIGSKKPLIAKPFYEFEESELYYMYLDAEYSKGMPSTTPDVTDPNETDPGNKDDESPLPSDKTPRENPTEDDTQTKPDDDNGSEVDSPKTGDTGDKGVIGTTLIIISLLGILSLILRLKKKGSYI